MAGRRKPLLALPRVRTPLCDAKPVALVRVERIPPRNYTDTFRFFEPGQMDETFAKIVREAYRIGCQEHHVK